MTTPTLEELARCLAEFERRYNNLMRNDAGLSPAGQGIGIALLTTMNMPLIAESISALRARAQTKEEE